MYFAEDYFKMKLTGLLCLLLIGTGLPTRAQEELYEGEAWALPDEAVYDYDDNQAENEELVTEIPIENMEPPSFNVDPLTFTPLVGETVSLPCTSDKTQSQVLIIKKESFDGGKELLILVGTVFLKKDSHYSFADDIFTINNVRKSDSSNYICFYQFKDVTINVTHTIDVYYEPSVEPSHETIEVTKGESANLECETKGNPAPKVTWTKQNGVMFSGEPEEVGNSITIQEVDRHADGLYECTADNRVGTPAMGTRQIIVSYPPEIRTENEKIHTGAGDRVELVCVVHAFPSADVSWTRNGEPVDSDTRAEVHDGGHRHLLTMEAVSDQDFGHYQCNAMNALGKASENIYMTDAPSTPAITSDPHSAEEASYTLTWTTDSYYPITQYKLMYRKTKANDSTDEPGEWMEVTQVPSEENGMAEDNSVTRSFRHTLTDLQRATDYEAVLLVRNEIKEAEEINFSFSTRKETADQRQTSGAPEVSSFLGLKVALALVAASFIVSS